MTRDFIKDLLKYLPAHIIPAIIGLITIPIITRLFPPGDYGNYALVMATISVLVIIIGWLEMSIVRFYPAYEREGKLQEIFSTVIKWLIISVFIIMLIFWGILFLIKSKLGNQLYYLMLIGALLFVFDSFFQTFQHFLRAKRWVGCYSSFSIYQFAVHFGIGLILIMVFGFGVEGLLWGSIIGLTIILPLIWRLAIEKFSWRTGISANLTKEMLKYGLPLVVGNLAAWILSLSDRYVLEFFRGSYEMGIYSASYAISEKSILLIVSLFLLAAGPIGMNIWEKEGLKHSQTFINKSTRYYLLICLPAVVGLSILAKPVIQTLTTPEYHQGFQIVPLVASGGFLLGLHHRFGAGLGFYKKTNLIMAATIGAGLLNLGLNFWLIPIYGYLAAALTTLIGYVFLLISMIILSRKYFVFDFPFKSLFNATFASGIMAGIVYPIGNRFTPYVLVNLSLGIIIGILVYSIMIFLLKEPQENEIQALRSINDRILKGLKKCPKFLDFLF